VLPPRSLEQAVWPWVDEWLAWFDSNAEAGSGDDGEGEADRQDLAAQGFLRLLQRLRIILLQDSVVMRREFPATPSWPIPSSPGRPRRRRCYRYSSRSSNNNNFHRS